VAQSIESQDSQFYDELHYQLRAVLVLGLHQIVGENELVDHRQYTQPKLALNPPWYLGIQRPARWIRLRQLPEFQFLTSNPKGTLVRNHAQRKFALVVGSTFGGWVDKIKNKSHLMRMNKRENLIQEPLC
tara:strand:- start:268 stop:657 length:390 start_codon:yes stop_codon:yes gene_type:complete